jgi:hypothetical protein
LVALGAVVAHLLPWDGLRYATTSACVALSQAVGLHVVRLSATTFSLPGWPMEIRTSCTMIDLYLAAIPLLWVMGEGVRANLARALRFFAGLMALNLARLVAGFWLFARGMPWVLAHEVFAGVVMFGILEWICRQPAAVAETTAALSPSPATLCV